MLRQTEWQLQNGPITNSGVLPVTTLFFWEVFSSSLISILNKRGPKADP